MHKGVTQTHIAQHTTPQCSLVFGGITDPAVRRAHTMYVLYGIFPCVACGAGLSFLRTWWMRRPLPKLREAFADPASLKDLKGVYRFKDSAQVRRGAAAAWGATPRCLTTCSRDACA